MKKKPLMIVLEENIIDCDSINEIFGEEYRVLIFMSVDELMQRMEVEDEVDIILWSVSEDSVRRAELLKKLRTKEHYRRAAVVGIVNSQDESTITIAMNCEVDDIIEKPFRRKLVHNRVNNLLLLKSFTENVLYSVDRRSGSREIDAVTGIYNAPAFYRNTRILLDENPNIEYAIIYWNIDYFKVINERHGRIIGDEILRQMADKVKKDVGILGTCGHIVEDSFACCVPSKYVNEDELMIASNYSFQGIGVEYDVSVHIGAYIIDEKYRDYPVTQLCDWAKMAELSIKGFQDRKFAFYDESIRDRMLEEQIITSGVDRAIREHQFFIQVQPIYEAGTKRIVSGEVLVRWNHPEYGMMPPGKFIPVLEKNGLIGKLDYYVWEETCKLLKFMRSVGQDIPLSVNVSRANLVNDKLAGNLKMLLKKYELTTSDLKLEITESAYTEDPECIMDAVKKLKAYSFNILMDDFGSGYSSLNMLKELPVDILKIDMRFFNEEKLSNKTVNIIVSIIRMAKWINMIVVAEGVETQEQYEFLRGIGCDRIQGYYFSEPMDVSDFRNKIDESYNDDSEIKYQDVRELLEIDNVLGDLPIRIRIFLKENIGGIGVLEEQDGKLYMVRANGRYFEMLGDTPGSIFEDREGFIGKMVSTDRERFYALCDLAKSDGRNHTIRFLLRGRRDVLKVVCRVKYVGASEKNKYFYFAMREDD